MNDRLLNSLSFPRGALTLLAAYFIGQWVVRMVIGGGLELDEAEQVVFGQRLQAGYSPDPPLYTWLQIPLFQLLGDGVPALSLLKNLLLFSTYAASYFIARQCQLPPLRAAFAALSLILLPQVGWESQRDLTHSVLVTTVAAVTLWAALALVNGRQGISQYLLLGLLAGLGMLSKFNYALFLIVLLLALASLRPRLLFRPSALASVLLGLAVVAPFLWWAADNPAMATATSYKLKTGGSDYWGGLAEGLGSLGLAYAAFSGLFLIVFVAVFQPWRQLRGASQPEQRPLGVRFLQRMFWITPLVMIAYLLLSGGTVYRDRWLLPLLFYLPLLCFALLPEVLMTEKRLLALKRILFTMMLLVASGLLARAYLYPLVGEVTKPHFPGAQLAGALDSQAGAFNTVIAESSFIGGNLKSHLGQRLVVSPTVDFPVAKAVAENGGPVLLIWNGADFPQGIPAELSRYLQQQGLDLVPVGKPAFIEQPYRFSEDQAFTLAWQFWE